MASTTADEYRDEQTKRCIAECVECHAICLETIDLCLRRGGHHTAPGLRADLPRERYMLRGSALHSETCAVCADVCDRCAKDCERFGEDFVRRCAEACRTCASS